MYTEVRVWSRAARLVVVLTLAFGCPVAAQSQPAPHQHDASTEEQPPAHDMSAMTHDTMNMPSARDGSGTSWLPDDTPMYATHRSAGEWMLMAHANAFLQYFRDGGERGAEQTGSINWVMGMASRRLGEGRLTLTGMLSAEPWTIGGCGYPDLLASGEQCGGEPIHDRQHPHDLFMELAAAYDRPLAGSVRWQLYGGPSGEPALGPVAFPHRLSALPNPIAPISHHWLDATHVSFGVVTGGIYGNRWKAEGSLFNGREPDDGRTDFDFAALDSWSGRVSFLPTRAWALQLSGGRLIDAEEDHHDDTRIDVTRVTASATYHRALAVTSVWATTLGWGVNREEGEASSQALFAETNYTRGDRDVLFGRFEFVQKNAHDLDLGFAGFADLSKLEAGYTRYFQARHWQPGIGGAVSFSVVPSSLRSAYGGRVTTGLGVFLTVRPSRME